MLDCTVTMQVQRVIIYVGNADLILTPRNCCICMFKHGSRGIKNESVKVYISSYPSVKTFVLVLKKPRLIEMVLLSTHNICFG